jgi:hypothetical protein
MYFMGHGTNTAIWADDVWPLVSNTIGPQWNATYAEIRAETDYRLGALIIHACHGADGDAWKIVSDDGIFWGQQGLFVPTSAHYKHVLAWHWGYRSTVSITGTQIHEYFGGDQETNTFDRITDLNLD